MTYEEAVQNYNIEQRKYYEYCGYINSYNRKIAEYDSERRNRAFVVNNLVQEIQKNQAILDAINGTSTAKSDMERRLANINTKVQEAAINYSNMISSNSVNASKLENRFGENATRENASLNDIFDQISVAKNTISGVIENLNQQLRSNQNRIDELGAAINSAYSMIASYNASKQRCLANMAYYRKFMVQTP